MNSSMSMIEQQLEIANRYLAAGDFEIAEIAFQQALQLAPGNAAAGEGLRTAQRRGRAPSTARTPPRIDVSWARRVPGPSLPPGGASVDLPTAIERLQAIAPSRSLACRIRHSEALGEPEARRAEWREEIRLRSVRTPKFPHVFFYNLTNSGASALDPILRELLSTDYHYEAVGTPVDTHWLQPYLDGPVAFYHWTHSGPQDLAPWLARDDVKFLCLYRDPQNLPGWQSMTTAEVIARLARGDFPRFFSDVNDWRSVGAGRVFPFQFEEMKRDIPAMVRRILGFLGLPVNEERLQGVCEAHTFERQTGRERGTDGPTVRTAYMARKGTSGDWRNYFDAGVAAQFIPSCGQFLIDWGYEPDHSWADALPQRDAGRHMDEPCPAPRQLQSP